MPYRSEHPVTSNKAVISIGYANADSPVQNKASRPIIIRNAWVGGSIPFSGTIYLARGILAAPNH